jgi:hypothetical protein
VPSPYKRNDICLMAAKYETENKAIYFTAGWQIVYKLITDKARQRQKLHTPHNIPYNILFAHILSTLIPDSSSNRRAHTFNQSHREPIEQTKHNSHTTKYYLLTQVLKIGIVKAEIFLLMMINRLDWLWFGLNVDNLMKKHISPSPLTSLLAWLILIINYYCWC